MTAEITERLYSILHETGEQKGFTVVDAKVGEMDNIHCFVSAPPKYSITDVVRWLKGISGRYIFSWSIPAYRKNCGGGICGTGVTMSKR